MNRGELHESGRPGSPRARGVVAGAAVLLLAAGGAFAGPIGVATAVPLPSSALMGMLLFGGLAAVARFPSHKRRRRR